MLTNDSSLGCYDIEMTKALESDNAVAAVADNGENRLHAGGHV